MGDRCVEQDLIPYVVELVLPNVPIEEWIIDNPGKGMQLPTHNGEAVQFSMMT